MRASRQGAKAQRALRRGSLAIVLALAVVARGDEAPTVSPQLAEGIRSLLDEGFVVGQKAQHAALKKVQAARKLAPDDPRVDYAYGLVLVRQAQHKQAIVQFEAAVGKPGDPYWPAWQALIWSQLVDRQYEKGLKRLNEFAVLVRKAQDQPESADRAREAARWTGQIFESLDKTIPTGKKNRELIDEHEGRLRESLGDELFEEFDLGGEMAGERHFALSQQAGIALDTAAKKQDRRRQDESGKLESDLEDLSKEKESTAKSAEEKKKSFEDALAKVDKELGQLDQEYQRLIDRTKALEQSYITLGREVTALELGANTVDPNQGTGIAAAQAKYQRGQLLIQKQNQMLNCQFEYNATLGKMAQTAARGKQKMQDRARIEQKYQKATGELVKKNADLDKWAARVADKKKKLDAPPAAKGKGGKPAVDRNLVSLKSLVPLDPELEKIRVLETFGIKLDEPATENTEAEK